MPSGGSRLDQGRVPWVGWESRVAQYTSGHACHCSGVVHLGRRAVLQTWGAYVACMPPGAYDTLLYRAHIEAMTKGLTVHLDDPSADVHTRVEQVLRAMAVVCPALIIHHLEASPMASAAFVRCPHASPSVLVFANVLMRGRVCSPPPMSAC